MDLLAEQSFLCWIFSFLISFYWPGPIAGGKERRRRRRMSRCGRRTISRLWRFTRTGITLCAIESAIRETQRAGGGVGAIDPMPTPPTPPPPPRLTPKTTPTPTPAPASAPATVTASLPSHFVIALVTAAQRIVLHVLPTSLYHTPFVPLFGLFRVSRII